MKHILLTSMLMVALSCAQHSQNTNSLQLVSVSDFSAALNASGDAQIIDVRTPEEFATGHLEKAQNINIYDADFAQRIGQLDKEAPVFVYCKAGGRSADAAGQMQKMGFKHVYDLKGGFMAWSAAGKPSTQASVIIAETFTVDDYEKLLLSGEPLLIDYYAPWCGPCKKMEPILNALTPEFQGKVKIIRINVDEAKTLVKREKIENIPVVTCIKSGKEIKRVNGFQDETALRGMIGELLQ
ncbi:MAG: thioredoxin domain-containing protein [Flavobacteriales bacterium]|jgi:thioredoxin